MGRFFTKAAFCTGLFLLLCLTNHATARADPVTVNEMFKEIGNDVFVTFDIRDNNPNAFAGLPRMFIVRLFEDDVVFDDLLGSFMITLDQNNVTQTAGGYVTSVAITHTFLNASNAFTGFGDDYILTLEVVTKPVPEPTTLFLLGTGIAGLLVARRKK